MYKCYAYTFLLITIFFYNHITFGMNKFHLNTIEKDIFLQEVKYVGIESLSQKITQEQVRDVFYLTIEFKFYPTENNDSLTQSITQKITQKEQLYGYFPHGKIDNITGQFLINPTNFLGYYTRYWHGSDEKGHYITCTSTFTQKEILERLLKEIKKTYYTSNL